MTPRRTRAFDPKRHVLHEGKVYERTREPEVDGLFLRIVLVQIGRLGTREVPREHAWDVRTCEQVIVED